ncbi:hypothetical protein ABPG74_019398 [Tetrahymena malaccensis]
MSQRLRYKGFKVHLTFIFLVILICQDICLGNSQENNSYSSNNNQENNYDDGDQFKQSQTQNSQSSRRIERNIKKIQKCQSIQTLNLLESQNIVESQECFLNDNTILELQSANDTIMLNVKNMVDQMLFQKPLLIGKNKKSNLNSFISENYAIFYYQNSDQVEFLIFNLFENKISSFEQIQQKLLDFQDGTYNFENFKVKLVLFEQKKDQFNINNNYENFSQKQILSCYRQLLIEDIQKNQLTIYQLDSRQLTIIYNSPHSKCKSRYKVRSIIDDQIYDVCNNCNQINNTSREKISTNCLKINNVQEKNQNLFKQSLRSNNVENEQSDIEEQENNQQQINDQNYKEQNINLNKKFKEFKNTQTQEDNFFQVKINQNILNNTQLTISESDKGDIMIQILVDNFILNPYIELEINKKFTNRKNTQVSFTLPIIAPQQQTYFEFSALIISFLTKLIYFLNFLAIIIGQFSGYLINVEIFQYVSLLSYSKSLQNPLSISISKYLSFFNCNWNYQNQYQLINLNKTEMITVNIFGFQTKLHSSDQSFLLYKGYYSQSFLYLGYTSIILLGIVFVVQKIIKFIRSKRNKDRDEICFYRILRVIQIELESDVIGNIIQLTFIELVFSAISQIASFCRLIDFQSKLQQIQFFLSILILIYATTVIKNLFMMRSLIILDMDRSVKSVWKTFFYSIRETDFSRNKLTAYPIMIAFRKIALALVTVLLYEYPFTQLFIIFVISLICSLVSIFKLQGPFQETILNYCMSIQELILLIIIGSHINYVFCYNELLTQSENQIYSNNQLVSKIETTAIIEVACISIMIILNLILVITFFKKNLSCLNKKQEINTAINQDDILMMGNNEKYYLLSQVDVKVDNQKKQTKSHTLSDEESLNPQEMVASKQQINQQMQDGAIEFNQNELNYYKEKPICQQDKQSDTFTPRKFNQSSKSFINNMIELEVSNNKILIDDHLPKTAKNFNNTNNNISLTYLGEINQLDEQKSQVNLVDDETLIPPPLNYELNDISLNEVNQTQLNQNDMLKRMKQKLSICNTSINYLQNLLNNYNVSTHDIQDQLNVLNDNEEPDSTNRNQLTTDQQIQDKTYEDEKLITFFFDNEQTQSHSINEDFQYIQM